MHKGDTIDFPHINHLSLDIASTIKAKKKKLLSILTAYETYQTAEDEVDRTLDLLTSLDENRTYFETAVGKVAVFMPSNQPLYSFACFAIVPALMSEKVCVKPPEVMRNFYEGMLDVLEISDRLPNIEYMKLSRKECVDIFTATKLDYKTNKRQPEFEAVIFTGTTHNADKLRKSFHSSTLFIANGSGHNPLVITDSANIDKAIEGIMRVRTYNQGQDCAAPNAVLIHATVYDEILKRLRKNVANLRIGAYDSTTTEIGPISRPETLPSIEEFFAKNLQYIDKSTDGIIRARTSIVEPTIVAKPLMDGANFEEIFAPVFVLQRYETDGDLKLYFEDEKYANNAMYITVYGKSQYLNDFVAKSKLHDESTVIHNIDLHAPGIERGVKPYGGYGRGASSVSKDGVIMSYPTLPQRELFEYIVCKKDIRGDKKHQHKEQPKQHPSQRKTRINNEHWSKRLADRVLEQFPDKDVYTCAAGISPSGTVHFGNFRDLFTSYAVANSLTEKGKRTRLILSWDDFDRFSEVPKNIDPSFEQYIGLPYSEVPSPDNRFASYAEKFEKEFEESLQIVGIHPEFIYQTRMYRSGAYDDLIIHSLQKRKAIADILLSFMPKRAKASKGIDDEEYKQHYYPIVLYSRFTGKDNTRVIDYDGRSTITYKCFDTGKTESVDITKDHIVKLSWKVDWPMRWGSEGVVFEPGGADHASPGGSFDVSSEIAEKIFGITPPLLEEYKFVGLQGTSSKMSSTKGDPIALKDLLDIYTPEILKWLYADKPPGRSFELSFGKDIFRQYDEFDKAIDILKSGTANEVAATTLRLSGINTTNHISSIPFRQLLGFGQSVQWDDKKLKIVLENQEMIDGLTSIRTRLPRVKTWLECHNPEEMVVLLSEANKAYLSDMSDEQVAQIRQLHSFLAAQQDVSIQDIETKVYAIPKKKGLEIKELKKPQRLFFKDVYNLLVGADVGPRLSTFLWAADRQQVLNLLNTEEHLS